MDTFNFLLNPLFFSFLRASFRPKGAQNFKFPVFSDWLFWFLQTPLDWLSYLNFCLNKHKIKLILKYTKKENISISPILKFSAQIVKRKIQFLFYEDKGFKFCYKLWFSNPQFWQPNVAGFLDIKLKLQ